MINSPDPPPRTCDVTGEGRRAANGPRPRPRPPPAPGCVNKHPEKRGGGVGGSVRGPAGCAPLNELPAGHRQGTTGGNKKRGRENRKKGKHPPYLLGGVRTAARKETRTSVQGNKMCKKLAFPSFFLGSMTRKKSSDTE